jgi:hypothetical protein
VRHAARIERTEKRESRFGPDDVEGSRDALQAGTRSSIAASAAQRS